MPKNNSDTKQIRKPPAQVLRLLFMTLLEAFHPAGAAWVALLAARGFSLAWCRYAVRRCAQTDANVKSAPKGQEGEVLTALLVELASGRRVAV